MIRFDAALWRWKGDGAWHFVTLPLDLSEEIRATSPPGRGFGSVRVEATVGATTWRTSVFPDSKSGAYVLPMKRAVRVAEEIEVGDPVGVQLTMLDVT